MSVEALKCILHDIDTILMVCTNEDVYRIGLAVADGSAKYDEMLKWILENKE